MLNVILLIQKGNIRLLHTEKFQKFPKLFYLTPGTYLFVSVSGAKKYLFFVIFYVRNKWMIPKDWKEFTFYQFDGIVQF